MINISKAEYRRVAEFDGKRCAEIEVTTSQAGESGLLVYVARAESSDDYEIVHMYSTDIDPKLGWYNDNLKAYEEIAEEDFGSSLWAESNAAERARFKRQLLAYGDVMMKIKQDLI